MKNRKILVGAAIVVALVIVFSLSSDALAASQTTAGGNAGTDIEGASWWSDGSKYVVAAFGALGVMFMSLFALFAWLVGGVFDEAILMNLTFGTNMPVITVGWTIARDVANMFFILVLLAIAIMTILRMSSYTAKSMLPKFIVIALLINFSLSFGLILIDFSNILGKTFYDAMRPGGQSISTTIIAGVKMQNIWNTSETSQAAEQSAISQVIGSIPLGVGAFFNTVKGLYDLATLTFEQATTFAKIVWGNTILLAIMMFVMLVSAVFLLIRVAMLAILLVLSPIAFIAMILPKADSIWGRWWTAFFNHVFYFPAFLFLMYFSVTFVNRIGEGAQATNFLNSPNMLMVYVISIIMMIASLIIAREMGIHGANAVMKTATAGRQMATGFVGGYALRPVARLGERLQQNQTIQSTRMGRKITEKMAGATTSQVTALGKVREEKAQWLAKQAAGKDSADWISGMKALGASGREKFVQSIPDQARGKFMADLKNSDRDMYDATLRTLQVRLGAKQLKDFEKAELQYSLKDVRGPENIGKHMNGIKDEKEQIKNFKAMSDAQRTDLLEAWHTDDSVGGKLEKIQTWKEQELDLDEQDKFVQNVLKRSSNPALGKYIDKLNSNNRPAEVANIIGKISPQQQVQLWNNALAGGEESLKKFETVMDSMSADVQSNYHKAFAPMLQSKSAKDAAPLWSNLPPEVQKSMASAAPEKVKSIYYVKLDTPEKTKAMRESIVKNVKESSSEEKYTKQGSTDAGLWKQRLGGQAPKIVITDNSTSPPTKMSAQQFSDSLKPKIEVVEKQPPVTPPAPTVNIILPDEKFRGGEKTQGTSRQNIDKENENK